MEGGCYYVESHSVLCHRRVPERRIHFILSKPTLMQSDVEVHHGTCDGGEGIENDGWSSR